MNGKEKLLKYINLLKKNVELLEEGVLYKAVFEEYGCSETILLRYTGLGFAQNIWEGGNLSIEETQMLFDPLAVDYASLDDESKVVWDASLDDDEETSYNRTIDTIVSLERVPTDELPLYIGWGITFDALSEAIKDGG